MQRSRPSKRCSRAARATCPHTRRWPKRCSAHVVWGSGSRPSIISKRRVRRPCRWPFWHSKPAIIAPTTSRLTAISSSCCRNRFKGGKRNRACRLPRGAFARAALLRCRGGDAHFGLYQAYDTVARRVYGAPLLPRPGTRRPGRIRVGYLSADLRNHVMGKMMWAAVEHHDRDRFELFFDPLSTVNDAWTERFRGLADHFETIADRSEREAAKRIAADELDILVDLSTNTFGAKPGILALKPARVQITHVASAGVVGLSTIDFKLTDAFADLPENQSFQLETLLPMEGCVYPYRHVAPAAAHPFRAPSAGRLARPGRHRRICESAETVAALPRAVARGARAYSRRRAGPSPRLHPSCARRSVAGCCPRPAFRSPALASCPRDATTQKIRRATGSSISPSTRCLTAGSTGPWRHSTCPFRS